MEQVPLLNEGKLQFLYHGQTYSQKIVSKGYNAVHLKAFTPKAQIAVQFLARERGEKLDPTPLAVTLATEKELTLEQAVRQQLKQVFSEYGKDVDPDLFDLDPYDGDFDDDEDFENISNYQLAEHLEMEEAKKPKEEKDLPKEKKEKESKPKGEEEKPPKVPPKKEPVKPEVESGDEEEADA